MKKEAYLDFFKNFLHTQIIENDDFFSNNTIAVANISNHCDYSYYYRFMSYEEEYVITKNAFDLFLYWIQIGDVEKEVFERFMSILITFRDRILIPIDECILPAMIEIMKVLDFKEHVIYSTIELYIKSPNLLRKQFNQVH